MHFLQVTCIRNKLSYNKKRTKTHACDYLVYFIIAFRQTGVIQGSAQNACKNGENKPKVLDFCTLAVYDILNVLHPSIGLGMIGALVGVLMLICGSTLLSFGELSWFW